jgi:uncharacterized protein
MTRVHRFTTPHDGDLLSCVAVRPRTPGRELTAVVLHGAGTADKEYCVPLMEDLGAVGCPSLALDFTGHGDSSGELLESSLRGRRDQARAVIDAHVPAGHALALVGFSMSGQTVADLVAHYGERVTAIGLCAPAVYASAAWDVPFGGGFTGIIRAAGSWRDSTALGVYRRYPATAVLVTPGQDEVIPPQVTAELAAALGERARLTRLRVERSGHRLGAWLREHPEDRAALVAALLAG